MPAPTYPRVAVFDLDCTLWPYWVDTNVSPPLKRKKDVLNAVVDKSGQTLSFFDDVPAIFLHLQAQGVRLAAASRTCAPNVARQALRELLIDRGDGGGDSAPDQTGAASEGQDVIKAIGTSSA